MSTDSFEASAGAGDGSRGAERDGDSEHAALVVGEFAAPASAARSTHSASSTARRVAWVLACTTLSMVVLVSFGGGSTDVAGSALVGSPNGAQPPQSMPSSGASTPSPSFLASTLRPSRTRAARGSAVLPLQTVNATAPRRPPLRPSPSAASTASPSPMDRTPRASPSLLPASAPFTPSASGLTSPTPAPSASVSASGLTATPAAAASAQPRGDQCLLSSWAAYTRVVNSTPCGPPAAGGAAAAPTLPPDPARKFRTVVSPLQNYGLGNQMFNIAAAYTLARYNCMCLTVTYPWGAHAGQDGFPATIYRDLNIHVEPATVSDGEQAQHIAADITQAAAAAAATAPGAREALRNTVLVLTEGTDLEHPLATHAPGSPAVFLLHGYFQGRVMPPTIARELAALFGPPPAAVAALEDEYPDIRDAVGVHIRRGDTTTDPRGVLGASYYDAALAALWANINEAEGGGRGILFIFCEDMNLAVNEPVLWATLQSRNINVSLVTGSGSADPVLGLWLLSLAGRGIVCPSSSYCTWAALLRPSSSVPVVFPGGYVASSVPGHVLEVAPVWELPHRRARLAAPVVLPR